MTKAKYPVNLKAAVDFQKKMFPAERLLFHCIDALESLEKAGNVPRNNAEPFIHELLNHYQERMLAQMPPQSLAQTLAAGRILVQKTAVLRAVAFLWPKTMRPTGT